MDKKKSFYVFVRTIYGQIVSVKVDKLDTVKTIKIMLQQKLGIPPYQQRLNFDGKQLKDDHALSNYNIQNESTIYLLLRLCGGIGQWKLDGIDLVHENVDILKGFDLPVQLVFDDDDRENLPDFMTMNNEALLESAKESKRDDDLNDCARKLWMAASHAIKIVMFECKIAIASRKAVSYCLNMILGSLSDSEQCRHLQSLFLHAIFFDIYSDGALDIEIEEFERRMKNVQNFVNEFSSLSINDVVKEKFNTAIKSFMVFSDDEKTHEIGSYPVRVTTWNGKAIEKNEETKAHGKAKLGGKEYDFDYIFF